MVCYTSSCLMVLLFLFVYINYSATSISLPFNPYNIVTDLNPNLPFLAIIKNLIDFILRVLEPWAFLIYIIFNFGFTCF